MVLFRLIFIQAGREEKTWRRFQVRKGCSAPALLDKCTSPCVSKGETRHLQVSPLLTRGLVHQHNAIFFTSPDLRFIIRGNFEQPISPSRSDVMIVAVGFNPRKSIFRNGVASATVESNALAHSIVADATTIVTPRNRGFKPTATFNHR